MRLPCFYLAFFYSKDWSNPLKTIVSRFVPVAAITAAALVGVASVSASAFAAESVSAAASEASGQNGKGDFWFESEDGIRSFNVDGNVLVPELLDGDKVEIEGDVINAYDAQGEVVASLKADLPEGVALKYTDGVIYAGSESGQASRCIDNKWVALGINYAGDALVCAPLAAGTGGAGAVFCGAAVGAGVTAASC
ncbi:hypothetical protein SAMN04488531_2070 [Corynebacterium coyleae]|nr:hypothetical protein CCOY_05260 [Corynebacterium coyleae]SEB88329.1 hypothetical protein SAMN04488531_2070 [Corynebacterium coyleae]